jgi:hypothetical protein
MSNQSRGLPKGFHGSSNSTENWHLPDGSQIELRKERFVTASGTENSSTVVEITKGGRIVFSVHLVIERTPDGTTTVTAYDLYSVTSSARGESVTTVPKLQTVFTPKPRKNAVLFDTLSKYMPPVYAELFEELFSPASQPDTLGKPAKSTYYVPSEPGFPRSFYAGGDNTSH